MFDWQLDEKELRLRRLKRQLGICKNCSFLEIRDLDNEKIYCFYQHKRWMFIRYARKGVSNEYNRYESR